MDLQKKRGEERSPPGPDGRIFGPQRCRRGVGVRRLAKMSRRAAGPESRSLRGFSALRIGSDQKQKPRLLPKSLRYRAGIAVRRSTARRVFGQCEPELR